MCGFRDSSGQNTTDLFDEDCFDEIDFCDENEPPLELAQGGSNRGLGTSLTGLWPWAAGLLAASVLFAGTMRWFWRRYLAAPGSPGVAYQRLSKLASLASAGPAEFQTPYQFGIQLQQALPTQETPLYVIVTSYVRSRYGNKEPTEDEQRSLSEAWRMLRLPMLWAVITRRIR